MSWPPELCAAVIGRDVSHVLTWLTSLLMFTRCLIVDWFLGNGDLGVVPLLSGQLLLQETERVMSLGVFVWLEGA